MLLKHAFNVLISRYSIVFKMILYYFVVILVFTVVAFSIIQPIIADVTTQIQDTGIALQIKEFITKFFTGDSSFIETIHAAHKSALEIIEILKANSSAVGKCIAVVVVFLVACIYVINLGKLPFSDVINHFMNSNSRYGFLANFFANLKQSALYSLLYLVTVLPCNLLVFAAVFFLGYGLAQAGHLLLALPLCMLVGLVLYTVRSWLFAGWIPAIVVDHMPVHKALITGTKSLNKIVVPLWLTFFMLLFLSYLFVAASAAFTFGFGLFIAFPTASMLFKVAELVLYYNAHDYHYYVADDTVISRPIV